jgi:two-component system chemotaxis response regulator CheB
MKFLITHQSQLSLARVRRAITAAHPQAQFLTATTLTEAYNLSEHHEPNCVLIAETLATLPECELLLSLFGILKITCVVLTEANTRAEVLPLPESLAKVPEADFEQHLGKILKAAGRASPVARADPIKESAVSNYDPNKFILIGASTGGIDALITITQHFEENCPPVLIVQHTGGSFAKSLIRLLNSACRATVTPAEDGIEIKPGHIYLAPDDRFHLTLAQRRKPFIHLQSHDLISGHRPSIDALFMSALPMAQHVTAALLTGMGKDGAAGLTELRRAGAHTIGQDQRTSVVYGMPRVAMEMGGVCEQLPLGTIGPALLNASTGKMRA